MSLRRRRRPLLLIPLTPRPPAAAIASNTPGPKQNKSTSGGRRARRIYTHRRRRSARRLKAFFAYTSVTHPFSWLYISCFSPIPRCFSSRHARETLPVQCVAQIGVTKRRNCGVSHLTLRYGTAMCSYDALSVLDWAERRQKQKLCQPHFRRSGSLRRTTAIKKIAFGSVSMGATSHSSPPSSLATCPLRYTRIRSCPINKRHACCKIATVNKTSPYLLKTPC